MEKSETFRSMIMALLLCMISVRLEAQVNLEAKYDTPYGDNKAVGKYAEVNGIKMYYETYGHGEPLFLIHGNGSNSGGMGHQIEYFKNKYRVIVADSRGHGKSELGTDSLTYLQMADDWAELANQLGLDSLYVLGWSDGGIIGLLLSIRHPKKVKKLAAMGANLRPDTSAVYEWAVKWVKESRIMAAEMIAKNDATQNWKLLSQQLALLGDQPTIPTSDLGRITAPVLILAGDKDIIREEHTLELYQHIPKAHLCIFPGETHFIPATDPVLFNATVLRFFTNPFKRPDSKW